MKLNHMHLTVTTVSPTREFLETYFELKCIGTRGNGLAVMIDEEGFVLSLLKAREVEYPKTFFIGFPLENEEQVNKMYQRLKEEGFYVTEPNHLHG